MEQEGRDDLGSRQSAARVTSFPSVDHVQAVNPQLAGPRFEPEDQ